MRRAMSTAIRPPGATNSTNLSKTNASFWHTARRLFSYVQPYRAIFIGGIIGSVLFAAVSSSIGALTQLFLDGTFLRQDPRMLALAPVGLVALFLLRGIGDYAQSYCMGYVGRRVVAAVRADTFAHMLDLPLAHYDRSDAGSLLSRITYQSELVAQTVTDLAVTAVRESLTIVATFAYLFWLKRWAYDTCTGDCSRHCVAGTFRPCTLSSF